MTLIDYTTMKPADVAERWRDQYCRRSNGTWSTTVSGDTELVYRRILQSSTLAEVDAAIGNSSWTHDICGECRKPALKVVQFGPAADPEFIVCAECLKTATARL